MQIIANGVQIEVDIQGPEHGEPILLIMGLGMQLIGWPDELVQLLVQRGFRVIRHDNRDVGLSQGFDRLGVPNVMVEALRQRLRLRVRAPYQLADMAADALGVLDALGIERAHLCGASMGGMIAQHLAIDATERVASLTLLMTSSGSRRLPGPTWPVRRQLMARPMGPGQDAAIAWVQQLFRAIGSPAYPTDASTAQRKATAIVQRSWHPAGSVRQLLAIVADGDRSSWLPRIQAPTAVVHGEADPLLPLACGEQLARLIPHAQMESIAGMGHDLPDALMPRLAEGIGALVARARPVVA